MFGNPNWGGVGVFGFPNVGTGDVTWAAPSPAYFFVPLSRLRERG